MGQIAVRIFGKDLARRGPQAITKHHVVVMICKLNVHTYLIKYFDGFKYQLTWELFGSQAVLKSSDW